VLAKWLFAAIGLAGSGCVGTEIALDHQRAFHSSATVGNNLVVIGGVTADGASLIAASEHTPIQTDGSIGTFADVPGADLEVPRFGHATVISGGQLYVIGGDDSSNALASVEAATVSQDGALGAFATVAGTTLATPRSSHGAIATATALYVFGGASGIDGMGAVINLASIERAFIELDGAIGPFVNVPAVSLATARREMTSAVIGNFVYVVGGCGDHGLLATVERAPIMADGSIGTFSTVQGVTLVKARMDHAMAVTETHVYVLGGITELESLGSKLDTTVEAAEIHDDGSLGPFSILTSQLATYRAGHSANVIDRSVYVLGGVSEGSTTIATVEHAAINSDGTLGFFELAQH
jgi:N-acetylneuraminic acid mutarotase